MGKDDILLTDLKNDPNYDFINILNDEQNSNLIGGNASDYLVDCFDDSPYHNLNFNCNYHDEDEAVENLTKNKGNFNYV